MASRSLNVQITSDTRGLKKGVDQSTGLLDKLGKKTAVTARVTQRGFAGIGLAARGMAAGTVGAAAGVGFLVKQFEDSNKIGKQTQAVLKSTGGAANVTAKQISDLATAISKKTGVDDEAIQSGENLLLTFTNVRNEAGKGNKIFEQATQTITDMSVALGQDTKNSAIQLGKALNDPIKGITALSRVGVSFDAGQKKQIKTLVESGNTLGAQKIILRELTREFGGSAAAQATGFDKLKVSAGNLAEAAGGVLAPALSSAADMLAGLLDDVVSGKGPIGSFVSKIADIPGDLIDQFNKLKDQKGGAGAAIGAMVVAGIDAIDWRALGEKVSNGFNTALKIGGKVGSGIVGAFQQVPWDKVGDAIGTGVSSALNFADTLPAQISTGISAAVSQVNGRQVLGKLVDIIGEAIDALFSPSFWAEHWKGVLATVTLVIPVGKLLKIPGFQTLFRFISKPVFDAITATGRGMLRLFAKAASEAGVSFLIQLEKILPRTAGLMLRVVTGAGKALSSLPGRLAGIAGDAAEAVARKLGSMTGTIAGKMTVWVLSGIRALGRLVGRVAQEGSVIGRTILSGIIGGLGTLGHQILDKIKDAIGWVKGRIPKVSLPFGIGDGLGKSFGSLPAGGAFGGSLMGARSSLRPFAAIGSRFGLSVSSGLRPGSITTSGNVSYHSSGEAIDMADGRGPDSNKMGFFRYMKSHFGGRLAELIYGPGRIGIKNGQPYNFGGALNAQHMDHVHVAFDTGRPGAGDGVGRRTRRGTGDGLGKFTATSYGPPWGGIQGGGVTSTGVNLKGSPHKYGVAVDPRVIPLGSKLKITPNPFGYDGTFTAFDTGGAIKGHRLDFYDWRGRRAQLGWGSRSVTVTRVTGGDTGRGKPGKPQHFVAPGSGRGGGVRQPTAGTPSEEIYDFLHPRPLKGGGPSKGFTESQRPPAAASDTGGDPNQPLIDALAADAAARQALADQLAANTAEIKRQTDFAEGVANTSNFQLTKSLADLVSGRIVGYGVAGRAFTPGTGVDYAY